MFRFVNHLFARGRRIGAPAFLAAIAPLLYFLPGAGRALEYDRGAIAGGQLWRILTAHWTHSSLDHLAWDVLVFAVLGAVLASRNPRLFRWIVVVGPVAISGALLFLGPQWHSYRGLSGVDSALFVALCTVLWRELSGKERWLVAAAVLLFSGKIAIEATAGVALFATDLAGQDVVPLAHLSGGAVGLLCALLCRQAATSRESYRGTMETKGVSGSSRRRTIVTFRSRASVLACGPPEATSRARLRHRAPTVDP